MKSPTLDAKSWQNHQNFAFQIIEIYAYQAMIDRLGQEARHSLTSRIVWQYCRKTSKIFCACHKLKILTSSKNSREKFCDVAKENKIFSSKQISDV